MEIRRKPYLTEKQCNALLSQPAESSHYDVVISSQTYREPVTIIDDETEEKIATFVPNQLSAVFIEKAYLALRNAASMTNNRGTAAGSGSYKRVRADGSISPSTIGDPVMSSIIGYFDRYPRMDYCRACAWNAAHPEEWNNALPMFGEISDLFAKWCPEKYNYQKAVANEIHPDFIISNTVFSTITVNKNFRTAYHYDGLNLNNSFSAFNVVRAGNYYGGLLVFAKYRLAVACNNRDVLFFKPQELHGNTPITPASKNERYERMSFVYYLREKMKVCGSMQEELQRGREKHGKLTDE